MKIIAIGLISLFLVGCGYSKPQTVVIINTITNYCNVTNTTIVTLTNVNIICSYISPIMHRANNTRVIEYQGNRYVGRIRKEGDGYVAIDFENGKKLFPFFKESLSSNNLASMDIEECGIKPFINPNQKMADQK